MFSPSRLLAAAAEILQHAQDRDSRFVERDFMLCYRSNT
jgi:hypothetical protein